MLFHSNPQNSLSERKRRRRVSNAVSQSTAGSWELRNGRLDAIFKRMLLPETEDNDTESADEAFATKVVITPASAPISRSQIVIDVASRMYRNRVTYFTPTLTFRAMIPNDSEVFRVVKGGSVKRLKKLLSSGAASLGDCDEKGRSLLNVCL